MWGVAFHYELGFRYTIRVNNGLYGAENPGTALHRYIPTAMPLNFASKQQVENNLSKYSPIIHNITLTGNN